MILENKSETTILEEGEGKVIKMSLDLESIGFIQDILSTDLYSDPIGSTVRETVSNALDSHRRAGVNEPIIVSLYHDKLKNSYEFSVEDFGVNNKLALPLSN